MKINFKLYFILSIIVLLLQSCSKNTANTLVVASYKGHIYAIRSLIKSGANVNAKGNVGITALMAASQEGELEVAEMLINNKADINIKDDDGMTALMYAIKNNNIEIAQALLKAKADINIKDHDGWTALMWANRYGYTEIENIIEQYKSTKNVDYDDDITPRVNKLSQTNINQNQWIFAIGIQKYKYADDINFAKRSAKLFVETISKKFGVNENKIRTLYDDEATSGAIKSEIDYLISDIQENDTIYFYYNGHGINDSDENEPYILPTDTSPESIQGEDYYKLENIYRILENSKAKKIIAFVDSCFTGYTDGKSIIKGKAGILKKPKKVVPNSTKMIVITAGTDKQYSNAYWDKGHRLFTYFAIKELINNKSNNIYEYYDKVRLNVKNTSINELGGKANKQEPTIVGNTKLRF